VSDRYTFDSYTFGRCSYNAVSAKGGLQTVAITTCMCALQSYMCKHCSSCPVVHDCAVTATVNVAV
jgi:hypothetical protein